LREHEMRSNPCISIIGAKGIPAPAYLYRRNNIKWNVNGGIKK
jgi:hypothetical protein